MTLATNILAALGRMNSALGQACVYDAGGTPVAGSATWSIQPAEDLRAPGENFTIRVANILAPKATFANPVPGKTFTLTADSSVWTISPAQPPTDNGYGYWQIVATSRSERLRGVF